MVRPLTHSLARSRTWVVGGCDQVSSTYARARAPGQCIPSTNQGQRTVMLSRCMAKVATLLKEAAHRCLSTLSSKRQESAMLHSGTHVGKCPVAEEGAGAQSHAQKHTHAHVSPRTKNAKITRATEKDCKCAHHATATHESRSRKRSATGWGGERERGHGQHSHVHTPTHQHTPTLHTSSPHKRGSRRHASSLSNCCQVPEAVHQRGRPWRSWPGPERRAHGAPTRRHEVRWRHRVFLSPLVSKTGLY
jgi:hypothetical protein